MRRGHRHLVYRGGQGDVNADELEIDSAITLPIGLETYAAYALSIWLFGRSTPAPGDSRSSPR